jgi:hypothetical protein
VTGNVISAKEIERGIKKKKRGSYANPGILDFPGRRNA